MTIRKEITRKVYPRLAFVASHFTLRNRVKLGHGNSIRPYAPFSGGPFRQRVPRLPARKSCKKELAGA